MVLVVLVVGGFSGLANVENLKHLVVLACGIPFRAEGRPVAVDIDRGLAIPKHSSDKELRPYRGILPIQNTRLAKMLCPVMESQMEMKNKIGATIYLGLYTKYD